MTERLTLTVTSSRSEEIEEVREHHSAAAELILRMCSAHPCFSHTLFAALEEVLLTREKVAALLRNYDAHASVLRRLLLKAASIMPEEAAGFILENVRNEYGNGNVDGRHQLQLIDLSDKSGVPRARFDAERIRPGIRRFIAEVTPAYYPLKENIPAGLYRPAIAAGAITATEVLALKEFKAMQKAFQKLDLHNHIWFDHVTVEAEHTMESLALALFFIEKRDALSSVEFGLKQVLDANVHLYDGLLEAIQ